MYYLWSEDWHWWRNTAFSFCVGVVVGCEEVRDLLPEASLRRAEGRHRVDPQLLLPHVQLRLHPGRAGAVLRTLLEIQCESWLAEGR